MPLVWTAVLGGLVLWFFADWRYFNRWTIERDRLEREGRWAELRGYLEAHYRTWRPFVRVLGQMPRGAAEGKHTIALFQLGDYEAALRMSERALAKTTRPQVRASILAIRVLILGNLDRYDEACALEREIRALPGFQTQPLSALAQLQTNHGRIDEAIAILEPLVGGAGWIDVPTHQARQNLARVRSLKGDFAGALAILDALDADGPDGYRGINASFSRELTTRIERERTRSADAWRTLRLLAIAHVHILAGNGAPAIEVLVGCKRDDWARPTVELFYVRAMALAHALVGDAAETDRHLGRMWEIADRHPGPSQRYHSLFIAGTSALHLGRLDEARERLNEALRCTRHPIDRHATLFRLAETYERLGSAAEAAEAYRGVVADGFSTVLSRRAELGLGRTTGGS